MTTLTRDGLLPVERLHGREPGALSDRVGALGTCLFVFLLYTNALVLANTHHGMPQSVMSVSYLLLVFPLVAGSVVRREPVVADAALGLALLHTGVMCIAGMFALNPAATVAPITNFVTEGLVLFFLIANAIRTSTALRWVIWVLVASAAVLSSLSVWQEVTGSYDNELGGFTQTNEEAMKVGEDVYGKIMRDRLGGPLGSPNRYAQNLAFVLPLGILLALRGQTRRQRILAAGATALTGAAIALTFSRGTALAVAVLLLVMLWLRVLRARHVVGLLVAGVVIVGVVAPHYFTRVASLGAIEGLVSEGGEDPDGAILGRATSNLAAVKVFLENPVVGVGPLQYFQQYSQEYANDLDMRFFKGRRRAHSLYLELLADTGALGLGTFLAVPLVIGRSLWKTSARLRRSRPDLADLGRALVLGLLAYFITATFLHLSYHRYLWMLMGIASAASWVLGRHADALDGSDPDSADQLSGANSGRDQS